MGTDTNFELVTSATLSTLRLLYEHNFVKKSLAVVFENSHLKRHPVDMNDDTPLGNTTWKAVRDDD